MPMLDLISSLYPLSSLTHVILSFVFKRNYRDQKSHFTLIRGKGILKEKSGKQEANDFCDKIGRSCGSLLDINIDVLQRNRESGLVSHDTTDVQLKKHAKRSADQTAALTLLNAPLTVAGHAYAANQIKAMENGKGSRWTDDFGEMNSKAKQRGTNTGLRGANTLHLDGTSEEGADYKKAFKNSIVDTGKDFDPWEMENAIRNSEKSELLLQQQLPRGITPPNMTSRTPTQMFAAAAAEETPVEITDVRDAALDEIILEDSDRTKVLQDVLSSLQRPYDPMAIRANMRLAEKGKSAEERVDGIAKYVGSKKKRG